MSIEKDDSEWTERLIKGGMAETIVRELFKELGFTKIYRFGMEHSMQAMLGELNRMEDPVSPAGADLPA